MTDFWLVGALVALILVAAILGAAEAALLRVRRVRLEIAAESGDHRAATMVGLLDDLPRVLNTVLLVVLLVQIGAATVSGALAARLFGSVGVTIASFVLTFVLFVYSEAIPKTYAVKHPETVARVTAPIVRVLSVVLSPIVSVLVWFADLQAPGTGILSPATLTEEEILRLASDAAESGTIDRSDHLLIDRAFELGDQRVDDVYVPRVDVIAVSSDTSVRDALHVAIASGHRRIPTYDSTIDNIVGVAHMRDLARFSIDAPDALVSSLTNEPLIVPESRRVVDLVDDMHSTGTHFAVVVDEFGGTAGIVTIEDVVERLVGRFAPGEISASPDIDQVDPTTWIVHGSTDTDDLGRSMGISLPEGEWNTVAGLMIALAGHIPSEGESVSSDGVEFTVIRGSTNRVLSVRVSLA